MILKITDGAITVTLHNDTGSTSLGILGARYIPTEGDGATVRDTIQVVFGGNPDDAIDTFNTLSRRLERTPEVPNRPVWLQYQLRDSGVHAYLWRSPILSADFIWSADRTLRQFNNGDTLGELTLSIERSDWWEGSEELVNTINGVKNGTTSPYNVAAYTLSDGNLPSPVRIELVNANGADIEARNFYITVDHWAALSTNQHLLTSGAGESTWTPSTDHSTLRWILPVADAVIAKLAGHSVNVLAAFSSLTANTYLRAGLWAEVDPTVFTAYEPINLGGEKFSGARELVNLGTLQVPTVITGNMYIIITAYNAGAGAGTLSFAQITPASGMVALRTGDWVDGDSIVHDGMNQIAYYDTGSVKWATVRPSGGPLMVWPGSWDRFHVLFDEADGFVASRTTTVKIYARPRRRTI